MVLPVVLEPTQPGLQAGALPSKLRKHWSFLVESNHRIGTYETPALTTWLRNDSTADWAIEPKRYRVIVPVANTSPNYISWCVGSPPLAAVSSTIPAPKDRPWA